MEMGEAVDRFGRQLSPGLHEVPTHILEKELSEKRQKSIRDYFWSDGVLRRIIKPMRVGDENK